MIDNLENICILNSIYCLRTLIVINKNNAFSSCAEKISTRDHSLILSIFIKDREITVTLACHHFLDFVNVIGILKCDQVLRFHEIADRHTLVDETGCRVGVISRRNHSTTALLSKLADRH